jgi:hypothetical protein
MFTDARPEGLELPTDRILVGGPPVSIFSPFPHGWTLVDIRRGPKSAVNTAVRSIADCALNGCARLGLESCGDVGSAQSSVDT